MHTWSLYCRIIISNYLSATCVLILSQISVCLYCGVSRINSSLNPQVGQTVMSPGPDVLTSCGNEGALLRLNQRYVVGVGGACQDISQWSSVDSYTDSELQQLRDYARIFEAGRLACGSLGLLPSLSLLLIAVAISVTVFG